MLDRRGSPWHACGVAHPFDKPRGGSILVERDGVRVEADEASLHRTLTTTETDDAIVWAIEYRDHDGGPIIQRSAHAHLKRGVVADFSIGNVGG